MTTEETPTGWIGPNWTTKENNQRKHQMMISLDHRKNVEHCPKWGRDTFSTTNQDLANILGKTYFHSDNFHSGDSRLPGSRISRFLNFQIQGCQLAWLAQERQIWMQEKLKSNTPREQQPLHASDKSAIQWNLIRPITGFFGFMFKSVKLFWGQEEFENYPEPYGSVLS